MEISDVEHAVLADPEVMAAVAQAKARLDEPVRRPGIGVAVDGNKLKQLREEALLERLGLSDLTRITELRQIAAEHDITGYPVLEYGELLDALEAKGIALPRHVGVSRDCIAKIENGDRKHPKMHTIRIIIETLNIELARRGKAPIGVRAVYADTGEGDGGP